jgi:hypothetical protein
MASHGQVLDLFNQRYLEVQDVTGNVEPLPTLVPYDNYTQNVLVYRMDTVHDIFMALLQDFTDRTARTTRKELWTWCVQWEVDESPSRQLATAPPTPKKPRLADVPPETPPDAHKSGQYAPAYTAQRRIINPALMLEDDMLRILIDIVQVDSSIVPNFIEFLYRWVDYYEGDGTALKAALFWEIPSLWDFEYHPLVLPEHLQKKVNKTEAVEDDAGIFGKERDSGTPSNRTEQLAQSSPIKKMREKPDLAALEMQTAESERLQYREVHYGIQPPKLNEPLPPLINIPRDQQKRTKYYAACFRSRQRALYLLMEAGITTQQIRNYKKGQEMLPRDTPQEGHGHGLRHYEKDAVFAQTRFVEKEKQMLLRNKQMEITISNKLAMEAQLAAHTTGVNEPSGVPLILSTPSSVHKPGMTGATLLKIRAARERAEERINVIPIPLVNKMKSKLFEGAKDKHTLLNEMRAQHSSASPNIRINNSINAENRGLKADGGDDNMEVTDMNLRAVSRADATTALPSHPHLPPPSLPSPFSFPATTTTSNLPRDASIPIVGLSASQQSTPSNISMPHHTIVANNAPGPSEITEYMRNLTPEQVRQLLPFMNQEVRQTLANSLVIPTSSLQPVATNAFPGLGQAPNPWLPSLSPPRAPTITVSPPEGSNAQTRDRPPEGAEAQTNSFTSQSSPRLPPLSFQSSENCHHQASLVGPNGVNLQASGYGSTPSQQFNHFAHLSSIPGPSQNPQPTSSNSLLAAPRGGIARIAPTPLALHLQAPPSPLSSLASNLLATSPLTASCHGTPIQILLPKIVVPGNTIGPGGKKMGNGGIPETDALLLGYSRPGSSKIVLSRAIFLPMGVWTNTLERVRKGKYSVLETYPGPESKLHLPDGPHKTVYEKLKTAYDIMRSAPNREQDLTKRWRVTKGPMTPVERGAVWEGWAVVLDSEVSLGRGERRGAFLSSRLIDEGTERKVDPEAERVRREIEELLEEEDGDEDM